jgi:xylulokinase
MTADLVIGVDSSTTACKAIAWDRHGKAVAETRASFELLSPNPNWYEQNTEDWWTALTQCLRELTQQVDAARIAALCITHQRETFVPVDEQCRPLRPGIIWLDDRSRLQLEALNQRFGADTIQQLTGKGPSTKQSLPKLVWLLEHEPEVMQRAYRIVDVHGFLVKKLTGRWVTSIPAADPMGIVNLREGTWATEFMRQVGLNPEQYVDLMPPGAVMGEISAEAAALTGLRAGTAVVAGAGDGQCAGLGANITGAGKAYLNLGTAMVSGAHVEQYVADRAFRTLGSPIAGTFTAEEVLGSGTFMITWFIENFGGKLEADGLPVSREEVLELAASKLPPGAGGLMLVPYWNAVMPPYWDAAASGVMIGWTGAHKREHFYRAILEGIAYEHRLAMDGVARATGQPLDEFILMGGGSRSALWCQIVADIHNTKVTRSSTTEATNLGAGILAAYAAGWYSSVRDAAQAMTATGRSFLPDDKTHALYDRLYREVYVGLFPAVQPYVDRLTELTY